MSSCLGSEVSLACGCGYMIKSHGENRIVGKCGSSSYSVGSCVLCIQATVLYRKIEICRINSGWLFRLPAVAFQLIQL